MKLTIYAPPIAYGNSTVLARKQELANNFIVLGFRTNYRCDSDEMLETKIMHIYI